MTFKICVRRQIPAIARLLLEEAIEKIGLRLLSISYVYKRILRRSTTAFCYSFCTGKELECTDPARYVYSAIPGFEHGPICK